MPGGVAQLGERLTGSQKVMGSSPTVSTKFKDGRNIIVFTIFIFYAKKARTREGFGVKKVASGKFLAEKDAAGTECEALGRQGE